MAFEEEEEDMIGQNLEDNISFSDLTVLLSSIFIFYNHFGGFCKCFLIPFYICSVKTNKRMNNWFAQTNRIWFGFKMNRIKNNIFYKKKSY